jgi:hypothetical protein
VSRRGVSCRTCELAGSVGGRRVGKIASFDMGVAVGDLRGRLRGPCHAVGCEQWAMSTDPGMAFTAWHGATGDGWQMLGKAG